MKFEWQQQQVCRRQLQQRRQVTLRDFLSSGGCTLAPALAPPINPSFPPTHRHVRFPSTFVELMHAARSSFPRWKERERGEKKKLFARLITLHGRVKPCELGRDERRGWVDNFSYLVPLWNTMKRVLFAEIINRSSRAIYWLSMVFDYSSNDTLIRIYLPCVEGGGGCTYSCQNVSTFVVCVAVIKRSFTNVISKRKYL